jgi:CHASE2 domain-containing sensor protein
MYLLGFIAVNIEVFDPFTGAFEDFELTDLYYNSFRDEENFSNGEVILFNIGNQDREMLAYQIQEILQYNPAVVGVNTLFHGKKDPLQDSILKSVIANDNRIVTATYIQSMENNFEMDQSDYFFEVKNQGFSNLVGEENATVRLFNPEIKDGENVYHSFAVEIFKKYDPKAANQFLNRNNEDEVIQYQGHLESFIAFDDYEIFDPSQDWSILEGKIILLGYLGTPLGSEYEIEDKHFTPLNEELAGRSLPDMYGTVIQANILAMMIEDDYVNYLSDTAVFIIAFILTYLHLALFISLSMKIEIWFEPLTKVIQLFSTVIVFYIILLLFANYRIKLDSGLILAGVLLCGDLLDFYESTVNFLHKKFGFESILIENEL